MALQSDGSVKAWGSGAQGQTQIYPDAQDDVHVAVAACGYRSFLLRDDEWLITWGGNDWKPNGTPCYHYRYWDGTDFVAIAAGWDHILALTSDGRILCWSWPTGEGFDFDYFSRDVPPGIVFIDDISAGNDFSLSLKAP
jgi:alpha-tubulin suppressor-like RCC1 family protein